MRPRILAVLADLYRIESLADHRCTVEMHERIKATPAAWAQLDYVGVQEAFGKRGPLEQRNCPLCGSTLSIVIRTEGNA